MSIHRRDLPDAPVRVHQSALNPRTWLWRCMDSPNHHRRGYPDWGDAWRAMEKHRRAEHKAEACWDRAEGCCLVDAAARYAQ